MKKKLHLVSLGCNKNLVDSEVMLGKLQSYTLTDNADEADVLIVNTCGFIGPAKQESLNTIFSLHEARKKDSLLVVSGCLSERYKEELQKELKEVDIFTGVGDYDKIDEIIEKKQSRFSPTTYLLDTEERIVTGSNSHAYIKLSEGCNQTCSFCAIPSFKGKLYSRTLRSVEKEVQALVAKGYFDFSFISQDSSSYLRDLGIKDGLVELIKVVENITGVTSARILYLYPTTTSNLLIQSIINSKVFHNYFDMPIQHISDAMLKRMKRGAGSARIKELLEMMKNAPQSFLRTGLIIGHPGESEAEFNELLEFMRAGYFDRVSLFPYSDEEATAAFEMPEKISEKLINKRIDIIEKIVQDGLQKSLQIDLNQEIEVVIEGESSEHAYFMRAKKILWDRDIDGEILINDTQAGVLVVGKCYKALVTQIAGDKLVATVTEAL
ncbi:MAG: 30S ribosomal protein S12 methylthiotransferase RimO [Sulfurospirillum sp.]|nr:30S ribosomal protein S12 methylthiotransferase RimO [Sulfurospirillum sp.]